MSIAANWLVTSLVAIRFIALSNSSAIKSTFGLTLVGATLIRVAPPVETNENRSESVFRSIIPSPSRCPSLSTDSGVASGAESA